MEKIAILDCGSQYTKVIDRKIRELEVRSEIFPVTAAASELSGYGGIIISGGPESVWEEGSLRPDSALFTLGVPVLGICYGMHVLCDHFGGKISPDIYKEFGEARIDVDTNCPLFTGLGRKQNVLMSHGDTVEKLPEGFEICANSGDITAAIWSPKRNIYGVQFHPEVDLTENGMEILENFLRKICGLKECYSMSDRINMAVDRIREQAGKSNVIVLVSGGVDSAVTAALLLKALPKERVYAIHVDHGFMRKNESAAVCMSLKEQGLVNLTKIDAEDIFFHTKLDGFKPLVETTDPEEKRAIIGQIFFDIVVKAASDLKLDFEDSFLAQGTLRPDLIESGNPDVSSYAKKIKTHHNDVDIIRQYRDKGRIIETNADWHKDEVRQVARMLGLGEEIASRQPFPGPGLAVRLKCTDGGETTDKSVETRLRELCDAEGVEARLLPVHSVGVQGDNRTYGSLAMIKQIEGFDWEKLYLLSKSITNGIREINRVVYCLNNSKIGQNVKSNKMRISSETIGLLRELDHLVTAKLSGIGGIGQAFAVLMPCGIDKKYSVAIRTFVTSDFMTGRPALVGSELPERLLLELRDEILSSFRDIEFVLYDMTSKPPATCEWE